ncbi:hypothetical protein Pelo_13107 [Pelomyxa schiedti]|nr:hypothetical protein Pelo_13107 [Pelomyxa schiedti]
MLECSVVVVGRNECGRAIETRILQSFSTVAPLRELLDTAVAAVGENSQYLRVWAVLKGRIIRDQSAPLSSLLNLLGSPPVLHVCFSPRKITAPLKQITMGTLFCTPHPVSESSEICSNAVTALSQSTEQPWVPCDWIKGLQKLESILQVTTPTESSETMKLANIISHACLSLSDLQLQLRGLLISESELDNHCVTNVGPKAIEECQKMASTLTVMAATLSSFSGLNQHSDTHLFTSSIGLLSVQSTREPMLKKPTRLQLAFMLGTVERPLPAHNHGLDQLNNHDHTCFIYDAHHVALCLILQMILTAFQAGGAFLGIINKQCIQDTRKALSNLGMAPDQLLESKRIAFVDNDAYLEEKPSAQTRELGVRDLLQNTLTSSGLDNLYVVGDVRYPGDQPQPAQDFFSNQILEYEKIITPGTYTLLSARGICLYERTAFPPPFLDSLVATHRFELTAHS